MWLYNFLCDIQKDNSSHKPYNINIFSYLRKAMLLNQTETM